MELAYSREAPTPESVLAELHATAEPHAQESEARLRLALEAGRLAEVIFHMDGRVDHSPGFAELFGHPPDRLMTLADLRAQYHPEDHDRVVAERAAILSSGQGFYEIEKRVVWPDGQIRWLYGRGRVRHDPAGAPVYVTAVYLDVTDRKTAERAIADANVLLEAAVAARTAELAESERRFRAIFDTNFQLTGLCALDGSVLVANQAALTAIGRSAEEIAGVKMWDSPWWRGAPEEAARVRAATERAAAGEFVRYEAEIATPAGRRAFDFSLRPIRDDAGRPTHIIAEGGTSPTRSRRRMRSARRRRWTPSASSPAA